MTFPNPEVFWSDQPYLTRQDKYQSWRWDEKASRYRDTDTGRFISRSTVMDFANRSLTASFQSVENMAGWVANGSVSVGDWQSLFRGEIKREYIRQYLSGMGGLQEMKPADWGSIGGMLKEQYKYLDGFANEIAAGNLSEAQIKARMQMYINSAREAHERSHGGIAIKWGADEVAWNVNPGIENCDTCLTRQSKGWVPVGPKGGFPDPLAARGEAYPGSGDSECLCILTPEKLVLTNRGWIPLLDVVVGDLVFTHKLRWRPVTALIVKPSEPYHRAAVVNGVGCTHNHRWYTWNRGWVAANDLCVSDVLVSRQQNGKEVPTTIALGDFLPKDTPVYDIAVEEDHSFCIENIFAHNTNCGCGLSYRNSVTGEEFPG